MARTSSVLVVECNSFDRNWSVNFCFVTVKLKLHQNHMMGQFRCRNRICLIVEATDTASAEICGLTFSCFVVKSAEGCVLTIKLAVNIYSHAVMLVTVLFQRRHLPV